MKTRLTLLLAACAALTPFTLSAMEPAAPKAYGLLFYSDTCGSCKVLDPKIEAVKADYLGKPLLFVRFDHSNAATSNQAALLADAIELEQVYSDQEKKSGYMLLVDADSKEVVGKLTRDLTEEQIKEELDKALN